MNTQIGFGIRQPGIKTVNEGTDKQKDVKVRGTVMLRSSEGIERPAPTLNSQAKGGIAFAAFIGDHGTVAAFKTARSVIVGAVDEFVKEHKIDPSNPDWNFGSIYKRTSDKKKSFQVLKTISIGE